MKRNDVNPYCAVWTFEKLPTWGHIAQMRLNVEHTKRDWGLPRADREAAYKQLPLRPEHANLAMVALRDPYLQMDGIPSEGAHLRTHLRLPTI